LDDALPSRVLEIAGATKTPERAARLARELRAAGKQDKYCSREQLTAAFSLLDNDALFPPLLEALARIEVAAIMPADGVGAAVLPLFAERPDILRGLIMGDDAHRVIECGQTLALLARLRSPFSPMPRSAALREWIDDYPEELHAALTWLEQATDRAQQ